MKTKKIKLLERIILLAVFFLLTQIITIKPTYAKDIKVAVLPFQNISEKKEYNWIGQGFSETLISSFANTKNIKVVERLLMNNILKEISFQNSGFIEKAEATRLGKLTGSNIIVSGSYQINNNEISVNARFIDIEKGLVNEGSAYHIRGEINKIFDLQERVAQELNSKFNLNLSSEDKMSIKDITHSTDSLKANELYIEARNKYMNGGFSGTREAIKILDEAIKADPEYSLAYALLGEAYIRYGKFAEHLKEILYIKIDPISYFQKGKENLEKAISLSPNIYESYRNIGIGYFYTKKHKEEALKYLTRSLELKPNDTETLIFLGALDDDHFYDYLMKAKQSDPYNYLVYENLGSYYMYYAKNTNDNTRQAITNLNKSIELNPFSWTSNFHIVQSYMYLNEFDNALAWADRLIKLDVTDPISYFAVIDIYSRKKDYKKMYEYVDKVDSLIDSTFIKSLQVYKYMDQDNYTEAYKFTRSLLDKSPNSPDYNFVMALIYKNYYNNCQLANYHISLAEKNIQDLSEKFKDNLTKLKEKMTTGCK